MIVITKKNVKYQKNNVILTPKTIVHAMVRTIGYTIVGTIV